VNNAQCSLTEEHPVHSWADGKHLCAGINPNRPDSFKPIEGTKTDD
jgi:hypothetical protein